MANIIKIGMVDHFDLIKMYSSLHDPDGSNTLLAQLPATSQSPGASG
jgi:hypothetical protein